MAGGSARVQTFSTRAAARILAVSPDRIRYWVRHRLINPSAIAGRQYRFAFNDLLVMRLAKELIPSRRHLGPIQRCFERVRGLVGPARPMSSLNLSNEQGRIVVRERGFAFEAESGQLILDFDLLRAAQKAEEPGSGQMLDLPGESASQRADDRALARRLFAEILGSGKRSADVSLRIAAVLERACDLAGALKHLLNAATLEPANAEVQIRLGLLYRKRGDTEPALRSFIKALELEEDAVEPHRNLAELYEQMGRKREALRHLSAVHRLTRDPGR